MSAYVLISSGCMNRPEDIRCFINSHCNEFYSVGNCAYELIVSHYKEEASGRNSALAKPPSRVRDHSWIFRGRAWIVIDTTSHSLPSLPLIRAYPRGMACYAVGSHCLRTHSWVVLCISPALMMAPEELKPNDFKPAIGRE